jgi:hypothetical protein
MRAYQLHVYAYDFTENIYVTIARRFISYVCMLVSLQACCRSNLYNKIPFTAVLINVRIEKKKQVYTCRKSQQMEL